jgi:fructosamine-3-kinase
MKTHTKTGPAGQTFKCEANGLNELAKAKTLKVAKVVSYGPNYITTEFIETGRTSKEFFRSFGQGLAKLHKFKATEYGFYEDNFIGETPQKNIPRGEEKHDWPLFYFNNRIMPQYYLAEKNGLLSPKLAKGIKTLENNIYKILETTTSEGPSLLHGDLWGGNYICDTKGQAVLIDPAVYYGHRETDLAMTRLFGGFTQDFYKAYNQEYPLMPGWQEREPIYLLYHLLNHLNIFGTSYLQAAENCLAPR